jgi:hypothetical protein
MRRIGFAALAGAVIVLAGTVAARSPDSGLRAPASFATITDPAARSAAIFGEMGRVLTHPRCLNCHPRTDVPTQTVAMTPHDPPVVRGPDNHGAPGLECATCHSNRNVTFPDGSGSLPGAPDWHLAPREMAWVGKSLGEICRQLKDPARNGGKTLAQLIDHNGHDELVGWGWDPGKGREPAPGTQAQFGALTQAWVESGAHCPA